MKHMKHMKHMKGGEPIIAVLLGLIVDSLHRILGDITDRDLPKYITELLVLLLSELRIDETEEGKEKLRRIVNMKDEERDKIFHDFIYSEFGEIGHGDPRMAIEVIYKNLDKVKEVIPKVLESIREIDVYILEEDLNLYLNIFNQFYGYLYEYKHNDIDNKEFTYNADGERAYFIEGNVVTEGNGGKRKRKQKQRKTHILKSSSVRNTRKKSSNKSSKKVRPHSI